MDYVERRHEMDRNYRYVIKIKANYSRICSDDGWEFLAPQLVYADKTLKCLSKVDFPRDWDITFIEND